ncbi:MAG TPA: CRISPR-associated helicase Cas3' [Mesotoga infera]|uniref:CRISPR-associated helicase Cas3 n=1 Tax=Mesotoga infera TaxID=1236046 RepID=A0A7C1GU19_9BACT|nr:CRISPR-associated helicase Cas3' [Mesotoga infera]
MKADHSASAHLPTEFEPFANTKDSVLKYLSEKEIDVSSLWQLEVLDSVLGKNVILIASTGMGKTELALLWNENEKLFYTLPLRTSVNAMFSRMVSVFGDDGRIGLLHSTASAYLLKEIEEREKQDAEIVGLMDRARQLSLPLSVSTADQLFTSTFKFPGYEKVYATLSYSNIVIDELQAYNPEIAAAILWGLKEVTELGSRFCLMTATLPGFYLDFAKKNFPNVVIERRFLQVAKHRIEIVRENIVESCDSIIDSWREKGRVLVVVNTVKQAQKLYEELKKRLNDESEDNLMLLHSGFILRDRSFKEDRLLHDDNPFKGIVVSTQVVEASLDIDFPVLFTEIAPADSLVQRMGRVERRIREGKLNLEKPNVHIFWSDETSGVGSVYERNLVSGTGELLEKYSGRLLSEEDKQDIVNTLYYSENAKKVKEKFEKAIEMLKLGILKAKNRDDAQKLFRDISSIECIPFTIYEKEEDVISKLVEKVESSKERISRLRAATELQGYTLSVKRSRIPDSKIVKLIGSIAVINIPYDASIGIQYEKEESPFV